MNSNLPYRRAAKLASQRAWKRAPLSLFFIAIAMGLFVFFQLEAASSPDRIFKLQQQLGMLLPLAKVVQPELSGLMQLWDGEFWRLLTTGYHHGGVMHLLFNCFSLAWLGLMLEPRMSKLGFFCFFNVAILFSNTFEVFFEHSVVGLSGGICAMFGFLIIARKHDVDLAERLTAQTVLTMLCMLFVMVALTFSEMLNVANLAHFSGLLYGLFVGQVRYAALPVWQKRGWLVGTHGILIPIIVYFAINPFWLGRYWWYQAHLYPERNEQLLQTALNVDPSLSPIWIELAVRKHAQENYYSSWKLLLQNLKLNRGEPKNWQLVRDFESLLQGFEPEKRTRFIKLFRDIFGEESQMWEQQLWKKDLDFIALIPRSTSDDFNIQDLEQLQPTTSITRDNSIPPLDPESPNSAQMGETL